MSTIFEGVTEDGRPHVSCPKSCQMPSSCCCHHKCFCCQQNLGQDLTDVAPKRRYRKKNLIASDCKLKLDCSMQVGTENRKSKSVDSVQGVTSTNTQFRSLLESHYDDSTANNTRKCKCSCCCHRCNCSQDRNDVKKSFSWTRNEWADHLSERCDPNTRPVEDTPRRRRKSSAYGTRRRLSSWSMNNATYKNNKNDLSNSNNSNNGSITPNTPGYLVPTVGCHCSHCTKIFGSKSQSNLRKKSRLKQQQQLHQQLQLLLLQQQQLQQKQKERLEQENQQHAEQPTLQRSYGIVDTDCESASRKTSTDSAVSTTTPESLFPETPEANRLLGICGDNEPTFSSGRLSTQSSITPPSTSAETNVHITSMSEPLIPAPPLNRSKERSADKLQSVSVETNFSSADKESSVVLCTSETTAADPNSVNISTTTVTTTSPHSDKSRGRTRVSYSSSSALMTPLAADGDVSPTSDEPPEKFSKEVETPNSKQRIVNDVSSDHESSVKPTGPKVSSNPPCTNEVNREGSNIGGVNLDVSSTAVSGPGNNLSAPKNCGKCPEGNISVPDETKSLDTLGGREDLVKAHPEVENLRNIKPSTGKLHKKQAGVENAIEMGKKREFPSLIFDLPVSKENILPLYRKTLSESNIFAKDHSSVERRKQIATKNYGLYLCKSAQPRFTEFDHKELPRNIHKNSIKIQYSEVNPFFWDIYSNNLEKEARQLKAGDDITHTEGSQKMGASVRVMGQDFSSHKSAVSETNQRHTVTPAGTISAENSRKHSKSGLTITTKGVCTKQSSSMSSSESNISVSGFEDFDLGGSMQPMDVQNAIMKYSRVMTKFVDQLKSMSSEGVVKAPSLLDHMNDMMKRAWSVPTYGHELGYSLCNVLKNNGGLDILLENCTSDDSKLKFSSAKVLEQCLTTENRGYVVEKGLENVVNVACDCTQENRTIDQSRVGTGILEHLFKHSEGTCSDIIRMGGLEAVVRECRKTDVETLRHCAGALANLSLYGGSENQQAMVQRQVAIWLFPLAFHHDDNIKYYACLAIAALVANTEIEAQVLKADTLSLIEPFVNSHLPEEFANSTVAHRHGQSRDWLERLVPVLSSKREEARNLAAFHFCMEAGIKKNQGNLEIFREIDAIEPLKQVASSPNAIASKYAAHALRLMGEEVPHKLSQQVPLWQSNDVQEWVKQIGFGQYAEAFITSRVDGDLLLQIGEDNLTFDIGISNGILRQRFLRELRRLRQIADYSSKDPTALNSFMLQLGPEYAEYTYRMLLSGVTKQTLRYLSDDQLCSECGILNSIHRQRLKEGIIGSDEASALQDMNQLDKTLDVFISYRRSNGSQLASLLKVHMQLKNFSVFIDVERLEAGKFDNNLLNSIRQARNFLLVLTPNALDRCVGDVDCKDWVHKEIVAALESGCNIIPIIDNFHWPEPDQLPDDMRAVCYFNGVRWIHDYQDACVDKLERFMRGEGSLRGEPPGSLGRYHSTTMLTQPGTPSPLPRAQPIYQRTTSTESGKGSSCSDKDFTGKD